MDFEKASFDEPTYRLIPSRFPPISAFDDVATADDAYAVMELEGWTNDRLVHERICRLPRDQWVYGRANSSVVMASFLHVPIGGSRFNTNQLGAWYAALAPKTAIAEVAHHLRREAYNCGLPKMEMQYRTYKSTLAGGYDDLRGHQDDCSFAYSSISYAESQPFGEGRRAAGSDGITFDSVRLKGGTNLVAYRPPNIVNVLQTIHYELSVPLEGKVVARVLST